MLKSFQSYKNFSGNRTCSRYINLLYSTSSSEWKEPNVDTGHNTGIMIYNCVHRGNVPFIVRNPNYVTWYTCGPTVYDDAHIGHAVCYMKSDIIQRILRKHFRLNLITAMNITDIDDKIIAKSIAANRSWKEIVTKYESDFWDDMGSLGIQRADIVLRVSEYMPQIINFIERLLNKNAAYVGLDGSVYFSNTRENTKLLNTLPSTSNDVVKTNLNNLSNRRSVKDFTLWKAAKPNEPSWDVPWNYDHNANLRTAGRPGWHTECASMATEIFGETIDVHAGGIDLKFPHHENEELQCCSYHDIDQWVNYWFHIGHLNASDNVKMSKSLKNMITIKEYLKHYSADQLRMACLLSTYHSHIQFGDDILLPAGDVLQKFISFFDDTENYLKNASSNACILNRKEILNAVDSTVKNIDVAIKTDFRTHTCIYCLLDLIKKINKAINEKQDYSTDTKGSSEFGCDFVIIKSVQKVVGEFLEMVGLNNILPITFKHKDNSTISTGADYSDRIKLEKIINDIMELRLSILNEARTNKNPIMFKLSDELRATLLKNNLIIKDHGNYLKSTWHFDDVITRKNQKK